MLTLCSLDIQLEMGLLDYGGPIHNCGRFILLSMVNALTALNILSDTYLDFVCFYAGD